MPSRVEEGLATRSSEELLAMLAQPGEFTEEARELARLELGRRGVESSVVASFEAQAATVEARPKEQPLGALLWKLAGWMVLATVTVVLGRLTHLETDHVPLEYAGPLFAFVGLIVLFGFGGREPPGPPPTR